MTALTAMDYYKEDDILTIQRSHVEGTVIGFTAGEQVMFADLLYGMLLPSGNDAAYAIADNYPGGMSAFVERMNNKAAALHLYNTHYTDPAGLDDDGGYTTARDLADTASAARTIPLLSHIFATKQYIISDLSGKQYALLNLNKLLGYEGVNGVKTGSTHGAGGVLVTSKLEKGHTFIIVVMQSLDRFADTQSLLSFINNNITFFQPVFSVSNPLEEQK